MRTKTPKNNNNIDISNVILGRLSMDSVRRLISSKFGFYVDAANIFNPVLIYKILSFDEEKQKLFFKEIAGLYWEKAQSFFKQKNKDFTKNVWETSD